MKFKSIWLRAIFVLGVVAFTQISVAGELRYTPINPTFGGNPANASALMAVASAQNDLKAPAKTTQEKFTADLETAILNRLEYTVLNQLFNTNGDLVKTGSVNAGNFRIEIKNENNALILVTTDRTSGAQTTINIDALQ